jgi:hypothetical protein
MPFFGLFFSCSDGHTDYYYKCFFLGGENFLLEGEIFNNTFSTFEIKLLDYINNGYPSIKGEISTDISDNKYKVLIDIDDYDITIENPQKMPFSSFQWLSFPENFPAFILYFSYNKDPNLYWGSDFFYENNLDFQYGYIYVAEPIDLSCTYQEVYPQNMTSSIETHHKDLNFSKSGWYKVIYRKDGEIGNEPKFSSGKDTNIGSRSK